MKRSAGGRQALPAWTTSIRVQLAYTSILTKCFANGVVRIGATLVGGLSAAAAHGAGFGDAHRIGLQFCDALHCTVWCGRMFSQNLKGHLDMMLLSVLRGAPAHGYAVVERLAEASEGAFELGEGTVYPALRRMEKAGLLHSSWTRVSGRDRRVYEVTAKGEKALAKQRGEWDAFSRAVRRTLEAS